MFSTGSNRSCSVPITNFIMDINGTMVVIMYSFQSHASSRLFSDLVLFLLQIVLSFHCCLSVCVDICYNVHHLLSR